MEDTMNAAKKLGEQRHAEALDIGDKGAILLVLYNASIELLQEAKSAIERGDLVEKGNHLSQTHAIISELLVSLDLDIGGTMAESLRDLYVFMLEQLMRANTNNDANSLDVVISLLRTLYGGWEGAVASERARVSQGFERRPTAGIV
jgi:flagellar secretion chaperone FliS